MSNSSLFSPALLRTHSFVTAERVKSSDAEGDRRAGRGAGTDREQRASTKTDRQYTLHRPAGRTVISIQQVRQHLLHCDTSCCCCCCCHAAPWRRRHDAVAAPIPVHKQERRGSHLVNGDRTKCAQQSTLVYYPPRPRGHFGIAQSVRLSVPWHSCLG